jgi:hypothetical protein
MQEMHKNSRKLAFRVDLDSRITMLSDGSMKSVLGLLAHLETLAGSGGKSPFILPEKEDLKRAFGLLAHSQLEPTQQGLSFRQLGRQIIRTARAHIRLLQTYTESMQLLVLINDWKTARRFWAELLPEFRTPLLELNFLEELWGIRPEQVEAEGVTLALHWQQFVLLQSEMEDLLKRRQSIVELSDFIEGPLGSWLVRFDGIMEKLDETSAG